MLRRVVQAGDNYLVAAASVYIKWMLSPKGEIAGRKGINNSKTDLKRWRETKRGDTMKLDKLAEFYIFYIDTINHSSDVRYISGKVSTPGAKGKIVSGWEQSFFFFFCYISLEIKAD